LKEAFFGKAGADEQVRLFARQARLALEVADPNAARHLISEATPMLARLNRLTELFESEAKASAQASRERYADLLDSIRRIAGEAKVITMNARIMAARAGDAGREFAVVAARLSEVSTEIETLSAQAARRV
jgi:methyl-accepting chemotaxis protein